MSDQILIKQFQEYQKQQNRFEKKLIARCFFGQAVLQKCRSCNFLK